MNENIKDYENQPNDKHSQENDSVVSKNVETKDHDVSMPQEEMEHRSVRRRIPRAERVSPSEPRKPQNEGSYSNRYSVRTEERPNNDRAYNSQQHGYQRYDRKPDGYNHYGNNVNSFSHRPYNNDYHREGNDYHQERDNHYSRNYEHTPRPFVPDQRENHYSSEGNRINQEHRFNNSPRPYSSNGNYYNRNNSYLPNDNNPSRGYNRGYNGEQPRWNERPYTPNNYRQGGGFSSDNRFNRDDSYYNNYPNRPQSPYRRGPQQGYQQRRPNMGGPRRFTPRYNEAIQPYVPKEVVRYKEEIADPTQPLRLNKFLANAGVCSRREADNYITSGFVTVNDKVLTELGTKVLRSDVIKVKDKEISLEDKVYVLLNKPKDYVTTNDDPENRKTVLDLVKNACPERIYSVGRLDRNTTGVLLLTNDGDLASRLMHPKFLKKKIYHVFLNRNVAPEDMQKLRDGVILEDGEIKADAVEYANDDDMKQVGIEIHSGKNRIVRRLFESLNYTVIKLDRVYFAGLTKRNLKRGQWRYLTPEEVNMLRMGSFE